LHGHNDGAMRFAIAPWGGAKKPDNSQRSNGMSPPGKPGPHPKSGGPPRSPLVPALGERGFYDRGIEIAGDIQSVEQAARRGASAVCEIGGWTARAVPPRRTTSNRRSRGSAFGGRADVQQARLAGLHRLTTSRLTGVRPENPS